MPASWWEVEEAEEETLSAVGTTDGVRMLEGDSGRFLCFCLRRSLSFRLFFWPLSWWEGCFSCWVDGEADRLLRPAMKPLPPPPVPPPPPAAPPLPPPLVCRDVFILLKWYLQ